MSKTPGLDRRRQAATLTACGATIVFSLSPTARHLGGIGGVSGDVWQWSALAAGFVLLLASLFLLVRSRRSGRGTQ